ncbi:MAG: pyridoxal phosphate-dependent aminotransferase [Candidatus Thorarchaeota archaeon]
MKLLADKLLFFQESVIREMTRKAIENDAINLSQGMPDFSPPKELIEGIKNAIQQEEHQYSVTYGRSDLRTKISEKLLSYNNLEHNPEDEITITCGAGEAIASSLMAITNPGDEIIVIEPWYENYVPLTRLAEGKPVFVQLDLNNFSLNEETVKEKITDKTKAIIINSPHNPTGKVFTKKELTFIADICKDENILAVTDEIYEHILFDNSKHISLGSLEGMEDRTITISGFSKTFSITGWRVGYVATHKKLMTGIRKVHDYLTICAPSLLQLAVLKSFELGEEYFSMLKQRYLQNRNYIVIELQKQGFKLIPPLGAYYLFADITPFCMNDIEFADMLVRDKGVAVVPGTSFYHKEDYSKHIGEKYVRFCFSQKFETIQEAVERISEKIKK